MIDQANPVVVYKKESEEEEKKEEKRKSEEPKTPRRTIFVPNTVPVHTTTESFTVRGMSG